MSDDDYVKESLWDNYNAGDSVCGILVDILHDMGRYNNNLYKIKSDDDEFIAVWGSKDLDSKMKKLEVGIGMRIEIIYNGHIRTSNGFDMKDFTVVIID